MAIPMEARLGCLFAIGLLVGGQINRGIYRLAWDPRLIGPWVPPPEGAPPRRWQDRLPVIGWWRLRREAVWHGRLFWLRPICIELGFAAGLSALYWFEIAEQGISGFGGVPPHPTFGELHAQYAAHAILIGLMLVATFIDFDEQTIPDAITIPGTLLGLAFAGLLPQSRLHVTVPALAGLERQPLHVASGTLRPGEALPAWLDSERGLLLALGGLFAWWLAILPWTWTTRRGLGKACQYWVASLLRRTTPWMGLILLVAIATTYASWLAGGSRWESYLSAVVGVVGGGATVWSFRIVGTQALGQEAMGFGDVTLLAMIGSFLGWQPALMTFFLAPAAAVVISVGQWVLSGNKVIAFGPYLCLAALATLLSWCWLWVNYAQYIFSLGVLVPAMLAICVVLTWALLILLRFVRSFGERDWEGG